MHSFGLGPITLSLYSLSVVLATVCGAALLWFLARREGLDTDLALDAALIGAIAGILVGRAEVVLANLEYFRERPWQAITIQHGGIGSRSLLLSGAAVFLLVVSRRDSRWRQYADALTPAAALTAAIVLVGATFSGILVGVPSTGPLALSLPDEFGIVAPRLPLPLFAAAFHLAVGAIGYWVLRRTLPPGMILAFWGASTAAFATLLDNFRGDPLLILGTLPRPLVADAIVAAGWLLVGLLVFRGPGRRHLQEPTEPMASE